MRRALLAATIGAALAAAPAAAAPVRPFDFNGDGRQELVAGLPRWQPAGTPDAGAVVVVPRAVGRARPHARLLSLSTRGVPGVPEGDDALGSTLAGGDFDGDGRGDLAVAAPGRTSTYVLRGSRAGLAGAGAQRLDLTGTLAAGDLDHDGFDDLVVGLPGDDPREEADFGSGSLRIVFGGKGGLAGGRTRTIARPHRADASFGEVLALGDVDRDGHLDIVEAATGDSRFSDDPPVPGHVTFCAGRAKGPTACRRISSGRPGPGSLAIADVTGDRFPDIVEGIPVLRTFGEDAGVPPGGVVIVRGARSGPGTRTTFTQDSPGIPGSEQQRDAFGSAVAAGDLDGDRFADIVVGAPGEDGASGRITIVHGAPSGWARSGNSAFDEGTRGVPGTKRRDHRFGASLALLDLDGNGRADLAAGVPGLAGGDRGDGAVTVLCRVRPGGAGARMLSLAALRLSAPLAPDTFGTPPFGAVLGRPATSSDAGS